MERDRPIRWPRARAHRVLAALLFVAGCTWLDDEDWRSRTDEDGDGVALWDDCDDGDAAIHPAAVEACDGLDNDCSGVADDDPSQYPTWYLDMDQDDHGDPDQSTAGCEQLAAYVAVAGDCDDDDDAVHPGVDEICDGLDQDCDGEIDEDPVDPATWYADQDGDDFGDADATSESCEAPTGYVGAAGDCDDADGEVFPGADEICNDGIDNDCDGDWRGCGVELSDQGLVLQGAGVDHEAGAALAVASDLNGDGAPDLLVGAPGADITGAEGGAAYVVFGPLAPGTRSLASADGQLASASAAEEAGFSVGWANDVDGDAYPEVLVGAPDVYEDATREERGSVYLLSGPHDGARRLDTDSVFELRGRRNYDHLGRTLATGDLVGGDGVPDLAAGAWSGGGDIADDDPGAVYLVDLSAPPSDLVVVTDHAAATIEGATDDDHLGDALTAGDLDADGVDDLIVSSIREAGGGTDAGAVYVLKGPLSGEISAADADLIRRGGGGEGAGSALGHCDYDGDGRRDLVAGGKDGGAASTGIDEPGAVWLITAFDSATSTLSDDAELTVVGDAVNQELGSSLDCTGDADSDGNPDLLLGAWRWPGAGDEDGAAFVLFGAPDRLGTISAGDADVVLEGPSGSYAGVTVAWMDLDASGGAEPLVGASSDDGAALDAGAVYGVIGLGW